MNTESTNDTTTRQELKEFIDEYCKKIMDLFDTKNLSYGNQSDGFHNFRETSRRVFKRTDAEGMLNALIVYMDKHWIAITQNQIHTPELQERLIDMAVYSLIALAIINKEK